MKRSIGVFWIAVAVLMTIWEWHSEAVFTALILGNVWWAASLNN